MKNNNQSPRKFDEFFELSDLPKKINLNLLEGNSCWWVSLLLSKFMGYYKASRETEHSQLKDSSCKICEEIKASSLSVAVNKRIEINDQLLSGSLNGMQLDDRLSSVFENALSKYISLASLYENSVFTFKKNELVNQFLYYCQNLCDTIKLQEKLNIPN
eukprot:GHVP01020202.1.p1 GENE.GHVP01020202.1~~GHVP01020202.1.p1  ORF type:complete len:159 (+),score=33.38 GHVP01020202.1:108-584(+)